MGGGLAEMLVSILRNEYGINAVYGGKASEESSEAKRPRTPSPSQPRKIAKTTN